MHNLKKYLFTAFILFAETMIVLGQDHTSMLLQLMQKACIPGMSLAYVKDGRIHEHYSLGVRGSENGMPVNDSTVFSAASLSKTVFSYAVFLLASEKRLNLDKPLDKYFYYKDVAGDPRSKKVTARMILNHSSGLPNWRDGDSLRFKTDPGVQFSYSGEGMVWLSKVVESITGKNIEAYISEKIFKPLSMHNTSYVWKTRFGDNFAYPHIDVARTTEKFYPDKANVAQSLQTTAKDFAKFLLHILSDKKFLLTLKTGPSVTVADQLRWGYGLGQQTSKAGPAFWQWGDNGTFKGFFICYPNKKTGLVYFANSYNGLKIAKDILRIYFSNDQPCLRWLKTDSVDAPELQVFAHALRTSVGQAVRPYYKKGGNKIDPMLLSVASINYLGNRFIQLREFSKAADFYDEGIKVDSTVAAFHAGLAEANLRSGNKAAAVICYVNAARLAPKNTFYRLMASKLDGVANMLKAGEKLVTFRLPEYIYARHVTLVGSFNDWSDLVEPMHWLNGAWTVSIPLKKGLYKYKFVVDGVWITDLRNPKVTAGSLDSELLVD